MTVPIEMEEVFAAILTQREDAHNGGYTFVAQGLTTALYIVCEAISGMHPFTRWAGDNSFQMRECERCGFVETSGPVMPAAMTSIEPDPMGR